MKSDGVVEIETMAHAMLIEMGGLDSHSAFPFVAVFAEDTD